VTYAVSISGTWPRYSRTITAINMAVRACASARAAINHSLSRRSAPAEPRTRIEVSRCLSSSHDNVNDEAAGDAVANAKERRRRREYQVPGSRQISAFRVSRFDHPRERSSPIEIQAERLNLRDEWNSRITSGSFFFFVYLDDNHARNRTAL